MKKLNLLCSVFLLLGIGAAKAQFTNIHDFNDTGSNGSKPYGSLVLSGGILYGTTYSGGINKKGNIFSIHTDGTGYVDLFDFNGTNGSFPQGTLTLIGTTLFGLTANGGGNGVGEIFAIQTNGSRFKDMHDFISPTGDNPYYGAMALSGHKLYGSTSGGGAHGFGVVFSIDTNGNGYKDVYDFMGITGANPSGQLIVAGTKIFGMTTQGGLLSNGNIYSLDTTGNNYKDLLDFNGTNGQYPSEGEFVISGKVMFGMTQTGGLYNLGNVFSIDTSGANFQNRISFKDSIGEYPYGSLVQSGNWVYGMTSAGGTHGLGNIFVMDTSGSGFVDLQDFNGTNGATPYGDLIESNGMLYGMALTGGKNNFGDIFSNGVCSLLRMSIGDTNLDCNGNNSGTAFVTVSGGPTPYTYSWTGGGTDRVMTGLSAGSYTVTMTDANGCTLTASATLTQPAPIVLSGYTIADSGSSTGLAAVTVVSGGVGPFTYFWPSLGLHTDTVKNLPSSVYCCTVTDSRGCSQIFCDSVNFFHSAINTLKNNTNPLVIYPNPNTGKFTIFSSYTGNSKVQVYNVLGENVYDRTGNSAQGETLINLNQPAGVYYYRVYTDKGILLGEGKFIVE